MAKHIFSWMAWSALVGCGSITPHSPVEPEPIMCCETPEGTHAATTTLACWDLGGGVVAHTACEASAAPHDLGLAPRPPAAEEAPPELSDGITDEPDDGSTDEAGAWDTAPDDEPDPTADIDSEGTAPAVVCCAGPKGRQPVPVDSCPPSQQRPASECQDFAASPTDSQK